MDWTAFLFGALGAIAVGLIIVVISDRELRRDLGVALVGVLMAPAAIPVLAWQFYRKARPRKGTERGKAFQRLPKIMRITPRTLQRFADLNASRAASGATGSRSAWLIFTDRPDRGLLILRGPEARPARMESDEDDAEIF